MHSYTTPFTTNPVHTRTCALSQPLTNRQSDGIVLHTRRLCTRTAWHSLMKPRLPTTSTDSFSTFNLLQARGHGLWAIKTASITEITPQGGRSVQIHRNILPYARIWGRILPGLSELSAGLQTLYWGNERDATHLSPGLQWMSALQKHFIRELHTRSTAQHDTAQHGSAQ